MGGDIELKLRVSYILFNMASDSFTLLVGDIIFLLGIIWHARVPYNIMISVLWCAYHGVLADVLRWFLLERPQDDLAEGEGLLPQTLADQHGVRVVRLLTRGRHKLELFRRAHTVCNKHITVN